MSATTTEIDRGLSQARITQGEPVVHTISHENPSAGVGTMDFITDVLDIHAAVDRDRKESLVDCSGQRAQEHRTVVIP